MTRFFLKHQENNKYIIETLELNGSAEEGDALFKINCVGCHGITARGLVGPDLHSITQRLNDKQIIKISIIIVKNNNPKKRRLKISFANLFDFFFPLAISDE